MLDFLRRDQPALAIVYFPGTAPTSAGDFARLRSRGYELSEGRPDDALWALKLRHETLGDAELMGFADNPVIDDAIRYANSITDAERASAMGAASAVWLRAPARRQNVLRDRKTLLRITRDVLGDDGVMVLDASSELPWSRAALDDELQHDAELDVEALYCIHSVIDDPAPAGHDAALAGDEPVSRWMHTHGLAELGRFDIDIVDPHPGFASEGWEVIRGLAMQILEGRVGPDEARFQFGHPGGEARLVPAPAFQRDADPRFAAMRDAGDHAERRSVVCEPGGRRILGLGRGDRPEPLHLARRPPPDDFVVFFPTEMTELMAERARSTIGVLRALMAEFAEFEVVPVVKMGYPTEDGGKEHLWFTVDGIGDTTIDATLQNRPFAVDLQPGERAERPIELLTDWMLMTPAGTITPRSLRAARSLREDPEAYRAIIAASHADDR